MIELQFNFPAALYLTLFSLLILALFWHLNRYRKTALESLANPKVQNLERAKFTFWVKTLFLCSVWILASLALMQPKGNGRYSETGQKNLSDVTIQRKAHEVIFFVDTSASMDVKDARSGETRLSFAKEIIDEVMSQLSGEDVSLYAFTSEVSKRVPPTMDYLFARIALREIQINEGGYPGTDFFKALAYIQTNYLKKPNAKLKTLILLSDGEDTELETLEGSLKTQQIQRMMELLKGSEASHFKVFTVTTGSKTPHPVPEVTFQNQPVLSKVDEALMQKLSQYGHGKSYFANDYPALNLAQDLMKQIEEHQSSFHEEQVQKKLPSELIYDLYFQFPLGIALLFLSFVLLFPDIKNPSKYLLGSLLFFLLPQMIFSSESDLLRAGYLAEAGSYSEAYKAYKELLQEDLTSFQRGVVLYNFGTELLRENHLEKAIELFQSIELERNSSPLFQERVKLNLAIALLRQATPLMKIAKEESYTKALYLLHEALKSVIEAEKAHCLLEKIEGDVSCVVADELKQLHLRLKVDLADTLQNLNDFYRENSSVREALPLLLFSVSSASKDLNLLEHQKQYFTFFLDEMKSWIPFWKRIDKEIQEFNKEIQNKFQTAWKAYTQAYFLIEKSDLKLAHQALSLSENNLAELIHSLWGDQPIQEALQRLLGLFKKTLMQGSLYTAVLESLQNETAPLNQPDMNKYMTLAIQNVQQGHQIETHLYLEEVQQQIRRLLSQLEKTPKTPVTLLSKIIDEQKHALMTTRYRLQIKSVQQHLLDEVVIDSQKETLSIAASFLENVYNLQRKEFPKHCQKKPWDKVLPLFEQGRAAATQALQFLPSRLMEAMGKQEGALKFWQEALFNLQNENQESEEQETIPQQANTQEVKSKKSSTEQILQLLQEMRNDDQIPPTIEAPKQVLRPW